jgi:hypothetical protein
VENLLVVVGVGVCLLLHPLFLLAAEMLLVMGEGRSEQQRGAQVSMLLLRMVHIGVNGPASFELLPRHTLFILSRNIKIIA